MDMEIKPFLIQSFEVFLMESGGILVQTPLQINLPVPSQDALTPAIVIGNTETFKTLFPIKGNPFSLQHVTYKDFESVWTTHRKSESSAEQMTLTSSRKPNQLKVITTEELADRIQCSTQQQQQQQQQDDDEELANKLTESLTIQTPISDSSSSSSSSKPNGVQSSLSKVLKKSRKVRKVPIRDWKWFAPEMMTPYSSFISSRAAFKMTFYCIYLRDPKRVMSMKDIRFILRSLGYITMAPEQGLVNSVRSYLRQFKRWEPDKPRGLRHFIEMAKDKHKIKEYLDLANSLLSCLDSKKGFQWT